MATTAIQTGANRVRIQRSAVGTKIPAPSSAAPPAFAPHIEARRADYARLASHLIGLIDFHFETETLDIKRHPAFQATPEERDILMNAIDRHMRMLFAELEMMDVESIRRFYVEMRLHVDQLHWEQIERTRKLPVAP